MMKDTINYKGPIAWMARNSVAANLLMVVFLVGGALFLSKIKQEVFPEVALDIVSIAVPYPGASPAEVEQGIILALEEELRGLDGVKKVTSTAAEGAGSVMVELQTGTNTNKALQDVKNAVDRISSFPEDAERPIVSLLTNRFRVISMILYGDLEEGVLRQFAMQVREELLSKPNITYVELGGIRDLEISVEVPQENLRAYNLTLNDIAREISRTAVELPAGGVKTSAGEKLLRTAERRDYGLEFRDVPIKSLPDGTNVRLSDIATITDGFRENDTVRYFNGKRAVSVNVFRVGSEKPIEISNTVKEYIQELKQKLPDSVHIGMWFDTSEMYQDRISLLTKNACLGLILVLVLLGMFLEIRLAFWVTLGIPVSVLGAFLFLPGFDISINMISLFAFIVTLGIIVDDAIVVGENVYEYRQKGMPILDASIKGAQEIAMPVAFSILTNIAAFAPLIFVPGISGKFWKVIPITVIAVFLVSWIESMFVLPAHLAHSKKPSTRGFLGFIEQRQQGFTHLLNWFIDRIYVPVMHWAVRNRYITLSLGITILVVTVGAVAGGHIKFLFFPKMEGDMISVNAVMPFGTPITETAKVKDILYDALEKTVDEFGGDEIHRGINSVLGSSIGNFRGPGGGGGGANNSHLTGIEIYFKQAGERDFSTATFANAWRSKVEDIPGVESLTFNYSTGPGAGSAVDIELSHANIETLYMAASELAQRLESYTGVFDIDDGYEQGKPQFDLKIKPEGRSLGITSAELAQQVRSAFYGARAFRQQRGRDEVWVMVKLPREERTSEYDIENLLIRTPATMQNRNGTMVSVRGEVPLHEAAEVTRGRAYTRINRTDGKRVVNVTADVDPAITNSNDVLQSVEANVLPELLAKYPGLSYSMEGEARERQELLDYLAFGFVIALLVIYAMLAIPFGSYLQPLIVMSAIPFGIVGAVLGHVIMGYEISMISLMGVVALAGVVVNDSLVLVVTANRHREDGMNPLDSVCEAARRRFRPILLTSVTTFGGLAPMIFETSLQARFLIPMAISLGYGIMFATFIILFIVPSLYMILEDFAFLYRFVYGKEGRMEGQESPAVL